MTVSLHTLQNDHWQVGILPETGASVAFGRIAYNGQWMDFLRPTRPEDFGNSSLCASFLLIPWSNRIKDARFMFNGEAVQLQANTPEGFAQHGVVRKVPWQVIDTSATHLRLRYRSADFAEVNWPFAFSADATYTLAGDQFIMGLSLTNDDHRPFPAGFGHHPYFVREMALPDHTETAHVSIPAALEYAMVNKLTVAAPFPITPEMDFRALRPLQPEAEGREIDHVLTGLDDTRPVRFVYGSVEIEMTFDPIYGHIVFYAPLEKSFFAIEPVTNTNDGFNLAAEGIPQTGVFVLSPGEQKAGDIRLQVKSR